MAPVQGRTRVVPQISGTTMTQRPVRGTSMNQGRVGLSQNEVSKPVK